MRRYILALFCFVNLGSSSASQDRNLPASREKGPAEEYAEKTNPLIRTLSNAVSYIGVFIEINPALLLFKGPEDFIANDLVKLNHARTLAERFMNDPANTDISGQPTPPSGATLRTPSHARQPDPTPATCRSSEVMICNPIGVPYELNQSNRPNAFSVECARRWSQNGVGYGSISFGDCVREGNGYRFILKKQLPFRITSRTYIPVTSTRGIATYSGEEYFDNCTPCKQ